MERGGGGLGRSGRVGEEGEGMGIGRESRNIPSV